MIRVLSLRYSVKDSDAAPTPAAMLSNHLKQPLMVNRIADCPIQKRRVVVMHFH